MTELLRVEGIEAGYGGILAVADVSLTVAPGEIVALLGANGAGKSSTLKAISRSRHSLTSCELHFAKVMSSGGWAGTSLWCC